MSSTEYMRRYRAEGRDLTAKARSRAQAKVLALFMSECPDLWRDILAEARKEVGLPVAITPSGNFGRPIPHGSESGYRAHRYREEKPCDACREAHNRFIRNKAAAAGAK